MRELGVCGVNNLLPRTEKFAIIIAKLRYGHKVLRLAFFEPENHDAKITCLYGEK